MPSGTPSFTIAVAISAPLDAASPESFLLCFLEKLSASQGNRLFLCRCLNICARTIANQSAALPRRFTGRSSLDRNHVDCVPDHRILNQVGCPESDRSCTCNHDGPSCSPFCGAANR